MIREHWRAAAWNLALLLMGILPLFFLLAWLQVTLQGGQGSREPAYMLETGTFYYVSFIGPVAIGGVLYQILLIVLQATSHRPVRRGLAVLLTPIIPASVVLLGQPAYVLLWFALPLAASLIVYGLGVRLQMREPTVA